MLADQIKTTARDLGFDLVGLLPATTLKAEAQLVQHWLDQGYGADMHWMRQYWPLREDPSQLVPQLKTIVCVAINYNPGPLPEGPVKVARYALGKDYHKLIRRRLAKLLKQIQQWHPEADGRALCDSAPVLERALAVRAGLGWQGKNGNLIHPQLGSWLLLGELFLTVEVPGLGGPPSRVTDHCGRCTRCLEACPTDAFVAPAVLDARRCIAYWTIENHDAKLPKPIAENLNAWAFGCDDCQSVCPWNERFAPVSQEPAFQPRPLLNPLQPEAWLAMNEAEFKAATLQSPLKRTGLATLKRNIQAAVASQNQG